MGRFPQDHESIAQFLGHLGRRNVEVLQSNNSEGQVAGTNLTDRVRFSRELLLSSFRRPADLSWEILPHRERTMGISGQGRFRKSIFALKSEEVLGPGTVSRYVPIVSL